MIRLADGGNGSAPADQGACLHALFEAQVRRAPNAVALVCDGTSLTYGELNARANRLAHRLRELGVGPDKLVGLRTDRSADMVVGLIGILKSGGAYLPLDPVYPRDRVAFMLEDSAVAVLVTQKALARDLDGVAATCVLLDEPFDQPESDPTSLATPDNLAYVIYTSGSTGKPKGALITHHNVSRLFTSTDAWFGFNDRDVWTLFHSYAFDFSVWELWGALLYGGRVVVIPHHVSRSPEAFRELLRRERVTVLNQTPSAFRQLLRAELAQPESDLSLRYVIFGGEALELQSLRPWFERYGDAKPVLVNMYGITETTVHVTYRPVKWADLASGQGSVIGVPIPDLQLHILDPAGQPTPVGESGEMYVGGAGVARGYLNRPELTEQRFIPDRFSPVPGARLYRTGDLARRLDNGDVEYLGRIDHQVKIRGFRIELGEIESAIGRFPGIREAVVIVREDEPGDRRIVAYVVQSKDGSDDLTTLRESLKRELPDYMVPSAVVPLDALPLTANGKVDKTALPVPQRDRSSVTVALTGPRNELERDIAAVWRETLQLETVGVEDNFFDLGGDSHLIIVLHERLRATLKRELSVVDLFSYPTIESLATYLAEAATAQPPAPRRSRRARRSAQSQSDDAIAVVGMAARFPGARDVAEYWDNLCAGREGVRFFTPEELDPAIPASVRSDPNYVRAKGVIEDVDKFDAAFFGITPIEAQLMDPQQRIMLEMAWTALENSGHTPEQFSGLIGVWAGMNWNRYRAQCVAAHPEVVARFGEFNTALANEYDFLAMRMSYKLNLRGPSVSVATACSTGLVAIAQASQSLLNGDCDLALAGGVSVSVPISEGYLHQEGGMLSSDGHCRTFDATSSGTTFNDGAGLVVLRRLSDAVADGDRIYGVIRGFAVNNDGSDKVSFTAPSIAGQEAVIRSALEFGDIDPATIGSVEAHGTGTPLGDPIEIAALKRVFGGARIDGTRCALGSVKSSVGHLIHAAGVAGFIKAVLSVYHGKIPPSLFFETPNPRLELDKSPFYVNRTLEEWAAGEHPRRAAVSSFGVGGTNAHAIVEEPPRPTPSLASGSPRVLAVSAKTEDALARQLDALQRFLAAGGEGATLDAIAHTLQRGRDPLLHRAAFVARSVSDAAIATSDKRRVVRGRATAGRATAFMFTGQGSQRAGMGQWLYANNALFRRTFDAAATVLEQRHSLDLRASLFSSSENSDTEIEQTRIAQPALFVLEYCVARVLEDMGVQPSVFLGHSIGEFVAATLAGVFSYEDALHLVATRGAAMQSMPRGSMLIVHTGEDAARPYATGDVALAAVNAPELSVLAGPTEAIEQIEKRLDSSGMKYKRLRTSHAFHSSMMDSAVDIVRSAVREVALSAPQRAVISTVTGQLLTAEQATDPEYWARQLRETVRFAAALDTLAEAGEFSLVEVGPGSALLTLALQHPKAAQWEAHAALPGSGLDESAELELGNVLARSWVHGAPVDWNRQWQGVTASRIPVPTYQFARTRHWLDQAPPIQTPVAPVATGQTQVVLSTPSAISENTAMTESNRRASVEGRVIKVLEDTSGYDLVAADTDASFSELGFDSLLLTQVSTAIKKELGADVTFRALVEDCTTIRELTDRLVADLPPEAAPTPPPAPVSVMAAPAAVPVSYVPMATASAPMTSPVSSEIATLIDAQLTVMRMQLQALGVPAAQVPMMAAPTIQVPVTTAAVALPATTPQVAASTTADDGKTAETPRKHTPGTRIERNKNAKQLTRTQQSFIDSMIETYTRKTAASKSMTQRHRKHLADPRTVSGFNPMWKEMVYPIVTNRSKGSKVWDLDGNEYVDVTNGFGPIFFGHSPDFVTDAVAKQIAEGIETGPQSPLAGEVAELFCELTGNERVAFANTGSEAVQAALRLARTVSGRDKVVMFEGAYHGIIDEVLARAGKGGAGLPATPGVPRSHTANIMVLPYGADETLARIREMGTELAAVLVETVQSRHPGLQPVAFLRELRAITEKNGTALVFDEVVSGFRTHPGGVQALFDIRADMATYGKVVAGGYPIGLLGGKAKYLDALDGGYWQYGDDSIPEIGVTFFAGTFVRHPVALAAAKAVLLRLKAEGPALQAGLAQRTSALVGELKTFFQSINANLSIEEFSSYFYLSVGPDDPFGSLLFYLLRQYGVHAWEFRPSFLTTAHSDADIAVYKAAVIRAVSELVRHGLLKGDAVALERLAKASTVAPPVTGARLGKDQDGAPAWFIPDPERPGKHIRVAGAPVLQAK